MLTTFKILKRGIFRLTEFARILTSPLDALEAAMIKINVLQDGDGHE